MVGMQVLRQATGYESFLGRLSFGLGCQVNFWLERANCALLHSAKAQQRLLHGSNALDADVLGDATLLDVHTFSGLQNPCLDSFLYILITLHPGCVDLTLGSSCGLIERAHYRF